MVMKVLSAILFSGAAVLVVSGFLRHLRRRHLFLMERRWVAKR